MPQAAKYAAAVELGQVGLQSLSAQHKEALTGCALPAWLGLRIRQTGHNICQVVGDPGIHQLAQGVGVRCSQQLQQGKGIVRWGVMWAC